MVSPRWMLLLALLCSLNAAAAVRLQVKADKQTIALGEALTLQLHVEDVSEPLTAISLDALRRNFNVYSVNISGGSRKVRGHVVDIATMTLVLYPLRSGSLQVPALAYQGKRSVPLRVKVRPDPELKFNAALDEAHPLAQQGLTLTLEIRDDGSMQWTVPHQLGAAGLHQRWLAESQFEQTQDGKRVTVHRYAWALMPLRDGVLRVEFPLLDAFRLGQRLRYPVAPLQLTVAAVPAYVPVQLPIGQPQLSATPLPQEIALGQPQVWSLQIQGSGLSEEGLRKLLPAFAGTEALKLYAAEIDSTESARPQSAQQTFRVSVPYTALRSGSLALPEIRLPYYDIALGRIEAVVLPEARVQAYDPFWRLLRKIAAVAAAGLALLAGGYYLFRLLRCLRHKRHVLQRIRHAADAAALRKALLQGVNAAHPHTLQQWLLAQQQRGQADKRLVELVQHLQQRLYGNAEESQALAELREAIAVALQPVACKYFLREN